MRGRLGLNLSFMILLAGSTIVGQDQVFRQPPLWSGIEITSITATVRDDQGRLVTDLGRDVVSRYTKTGRHKPSLRSLRTSAFQSASPFSSTPAIACSASA